MSRLVEKSIKLVFDWLLYSLLFAEHFAFAFHDLSCMKIKYDILLSLSAAGGRVAYLQACPHWIKNESGRKRRYAHIFIVQHFIFYFYIGESSQLPVATVAVPFSLSEPVRQRKTEERKFEKLDRCCWRSQIQHLCLACVERTPLAKILYSSVASSRPTLLRWVK